MCTLADGSTYYKESDGTLYDLNTQEPVGTWNEEDNTLVIFNSDDDSSDGNGDD